MCSKGAAAAEPSYDSAQRTPVKPGLLGSAPMMISTALPAIQPGWSMSSWMMGAIFAVIFWPPAFQGSGSHGTAAAVFGRFDITYGATKPSELGVR
jgi:hypothetical protein